MRTLALLFLVFIQLTFSRHFQSNPAFNNWVNSGQNPASSNLVNGSQLRPGTNPAFNNWVNGSNLNPQNPQNPAFNNWINGTGTRPGSAGQNAWNNWANSNSANSQGKNAFNNWINNSSSNAGDLDNRLRSFLTQNRVNAAVPDANSCMRYTISNSSPNYQVTCALPNGQKFVQSCFGNANCNMVTCKLSMCSRLQGGGLYRVAI